MLKISFEKKQKKRCPSCFMGRTFSKKVLDYHDFRWCKPCFEDKELFALLTLEIMQAGLSWGIILEKEMAIRKAFDFFEIELIANYKIEKIKKLLNNKNIIRNSKKIGAIVENAKSTLRIQNNFGSFSNYIWHFVNFQPIDHKIKDFSDIPVKNDLSDKISSNLKKQGFKFIGSTIIYSYLQAIGVFNDHHIDCDFR